MIETGAGLVKPDGAVPGAMSGVHHEKVFEPVPRFQQKGCLFRHDQHVEAAKKGEIVAIDEEFGGGNQPAEQSGQAQGTRRQLQFDMLDARPQPFPGDPPNFR